MEMVHRIATAVFALMLAFGLCTLLDPPATHVLVVQARASMQEIQEGQLAIADTYENASHLSVHDAFANMVSGGTQLAAVNMARPSSITVGLESFASNFFAGITR
jgi:hypothetical protein